MSDPQRTIDEIFDELLDLPADERPARLQHLCQGDRTLQAEVEGLLSAYESSGEFLEEPIGGWLSDQEPSSGLPFGGRIGSYELLECVGRGGMGDVYLARRDGDVYEQRFALKTMRTTLFGEDLERRFRNECTVLAKLDHPNIARMVEGAITEDGVPYLVMEYVDGRPIDRYCDEEQVDLRGRITLVRAVCAALQNLHQHSTVHRDIKPANVLVKSDGQVKLIDFGIARVLDVANQGTAEMTVAGFERMTPSYASPEQLSGDFLTTATDIYSTGVLLFNVLTGGLPFEGRSRQEVEHEIRTRATTRPSEMVRRLQARSSLARQLEGDVDTIVLVALRREPERRYSSIEQLDDDLRRYLAGQPVAARGDSVAYLASKFVRRNALAVGTGALLLITLVVASITGFVLYSRAEHSRKIAAAESETARSVSDFLQSLLANADPNAASDARQVTVREALDRAAVRVDSELAGQPRVATELRLTLARAYHNLGQLEAGLAQYDAARATLPPDDPDLASRLNAEAAETHMVLQAFATAESLVGLALADSSHLSLPTFASAQLAAARLYSKQGRLEEAADHAQRAYLLARGLPPRTHLPMQTASVRGEVAAALGDFVAAKSLMREAISAASAGPGPRSLSTAIAMQNLGYVLLTSGEPTTAVNVLEEALPILEEIYGSDHFEVATTRTNLGDALQRSGRYSEALIQYERSEGILRSTLGTASAKYGTLVNNLALARWKLGELDSAARGFEEAAEIYAAVVGERHPWVGIAINNLAQIRAQQQRPDEAGTLARRCRSIFEESLPPDHYLLARPAAVLAEVDTEFGDFEAAQARLDRAIALTSDLTLLHPDRIRVVLVQARCRARAGDTEGARAGIENYLAAARADSVSDSASLDAIREFLAESK